MTSDTARAEAAVLSEALKRLRVSEELYRHVVDLSNLIPWTSDDHGNILTVGDRWTDRTGATIAEALGVGWIDFLHPDDLERVTQAWSKALRERSPLQIEYRLRTSSYEYRWFRARTRRRDDGKSAGIWYGTLEDVHESRTALDAFHRMQGDLDRVSRLGAMGAMASALAHDLNQPLTAAAHYIRGSRRLLAGMNGAVKPEIADGLESADKSIVRAGDIVRGVRDFVMRGAVERRPHRLVPLVEEACSFALDDADARGVVHREAFEIDKPVLVDRVQIQQVLVNLIRNAVDALEGQSRREIMISTRQGPKGFCEVQVCDTGPGISPRSVDHLFDPFHTTRKGGMGVGLSISRMIVEAHGGTIWNASREGEGATIAFTLPTAPISDRDDKPGDVL